MTGLAEYLPQTRGKLLILMVRSEGLEPPTPWFEAKYSIQLSYECKIVVGRIGVEPMTQRLRAFCSTS